MQITNYNFMVCLLNTSYDYLYFVSFPQILIFLFVTRLCAGKSPADDEESDVEKQYRLFGRFPITELMQDDQLTDDSLAGADPLDSSYGAFQSFIQRQRLNLSLEIFTWTFIIFYSFRARPRHNSPYEPAFFPPLMKPETSAGGQMFNGGQYDSEKELESSQPYGIQNVLEGQNARLPRSKNHLAKVWFTELFLICWNRYRLLQFDMKIFKEWHWSIHIVENRWPF